MHLAYLLLFLLHLSASTCGATSRNQHLFLPAGGGAAPAFSPAVHDHHGHAAKDLSFYDVHYHPALMARRGGVEGAPPPSLPAAVEATSGGVAGSTPPPPPEKEAGAAVEPSPPPPELDDGGGGEQEEESAADDVGVDYAGPKTHPPSHN